MNRLTAEMQFPCQGLASEQPSSISQSAGNSGAHSVSIATHSQSEWLAAGESALLANGTPAPVLRALANRSAESLPESMPGSHNPPAAEGTATAADKNLRICPEANVSNSDAIVAEPVKVSPPPVSTHPDRNPGMIRESESQENLTEQRLIPASNREILRSALLRICGLPDDINTDNGILASCVGWLSGPKWRSPEWFIMEAVEAFFRLKKTANKVQPPHREQQLLQQFMGSSVCTWLHRMAAGKNLVSVEAGLRRAGVDINHKYERGDYCHSVCCKTSYDKRPCCSIPGDTPLMLAERNEHWNMLGTLLEADDTDIRQLTYGKEHLLCRLFKFRANFGIDDSSLMSLTKIILKKYARKMVNSEPPRWGRQVPLALYAFIHAALKGVNTRLMTTILADYPWVRPLLKEDETATNLLFDVATGNEELPHTIDYLLDLQDQNGQLLIEVERFNDRNGSRGYRIGITQPAKDNHPRRVVSRSVTNLPGLVLQAGIKKSMMERLLLAVNKRQLQSRESI